MSSAVKYYARLRDEQISIYEYYARQHAMNYKGLLILLWLYNCPQGISQQRIAQKTFSTKQVVNSHIKKYKALGYIHATLSQKDKRQDLLSLSEAGCQYVKNIIAPLDDAEAAAFAQLSEQEQQLLLQASEKFNLSLKQQLLQHHTPLKETSND